MEERSSLNVRVLSAIADFASKEETRFYLNGVHVEIGSRDVVYVATDGHRLVAHRCFIAGDAPENAVLGKFTLPTRVCKAHKFGKDAVADGSLSLLDERRLCLSYDDIGIEFEPIDGTSFPNWRAAVPSSPASGQLAQFNYAYAADLKKLGEKLGIGMPFIAPNGDGPASVWFPQGDDTVACLMPVRSGDYLKRVAPSWAAAHPESARAA